MNIEYELKNMVCKAADYICYEELRTIEDVIEEQGIHMFSVDYNQRISDVIYGEQKQDKKGFLKNETKGKKVKCKDIFLVAILLILCVSTAIAAEPVCDKLIHAFYVVFPNNVEIQKDSIQNEYKEKSNKSMITKIPGYIPREFEIVEENLNEEIRMLTMTWMNNEEKLLCYSQFDIGSGTNAITSNGRQPETITVNGNEAKIIWDDNNVGTLFYEANRYIYMISGELSEQELIKILESID